MAVICSDIGLLYFCAAKAGSTSISNMLIRFFNGKSIPDNHIWDSTKSQILVDQKHCTFKDLIKYDVLTLDQVRNLHIVVNARNPFDWVLSDYLFKLQCYESYLEGNAPDWITARAHILAQTASVSFDEHVSNKYADKNYSVFAHYIDGIEDLNGVEYDIVKIEQINDDFPKVIKKLGINDCPYIGKENATKAKKDDYQGYYTSESRLIIENSFAHDIKLLGYVF